MGAEQKSIFLINAYTDTEVKKDILRDLVVNIKRMGSEVCLISHTPTPSDIIDRCDYFIFDSHNPMIYDSEYQYWQWYRCDDYTIEYLSPKSVIHFLAYFRLILGGLSYLKTFGYDIVHSFDYDVSLTSLSEMNDNVEKLKKYDTISYIGHNGFRLTIFSANLNSIDDAKLIYNEAGLKATYLKFYDQNRLPLIENMLFDEILPKNRYDKDISEFERFSKVNISRVFDAVNGFDLTLFSMDDVIHLFVNNWGTALLHIDVISDDLWKIEMEPRYAGYFKLDAVAKFTGDVKIYVNNVLVVKKDSISFFLNNFRFVKN